MKIEDQVALLMQGTEYGDEEIKKVMTVELSERLIRAEHRNGHSRFIADTTRHALTFTLPQ